MRIKYLGPGTLIAAAFIGPGTVTTCIMAGVEKSYELTWALLFSTLACLFLQEMSARLGFASKKGLAEAIRSELDTSVFKWPVFLLIIASILIGNAAYEAGNISGAVIGLELLDLQIHNSSAYIGLFCFILLFWGKYKWIENFLITLVILMSLSYLITVIIVKPDLTSILRSLVPVKIDSGNLLLILGLIGTTVVPYNLFLHASLIARHHDGKKSLKDIRIENSVSIILGGLISVLILILAAATRGELTEVQSAADLTIQLEPVFGQTARSLTAIGLLSAGLSSSLTAALAAAYVAKGLFNWQTGENSLAFRLSWFIIILCGVIVVSRSLDTISVIKFAQVTNALILPFIACFLIYACNREKIIGNYRNTKIQNLISVLLVVLCTALCFRSFSLIF